MNSKLFVSRHSYPHQIQDLPLLEMLQMVEIARDTHCGTKPDTSLDAGRLIGLSMDCLLTAVGEERDSFAKLEAR